MMDRPIAIVIPFYNGMETILLVVQGCVRVLNELGLDYRIIVVDDSDDQGKHVNLQSELSGIEKVGILKLSQNFGQHVATFIGLLHTSNEDVITIDEDLQFNPEDISKLINHARKSNYEVVYGHIQRKGVKGLVRETAISAVKPLLASRYPKFTSSFRFLDKGLIDNLKKQRPIFIQMEGLILHNANKFGYVELDSADQRQETDSGYSILALFWLLAGLVIHYSMVPLTLASVLMIGCNTALLLHQDLLGILLIPFSTLGILVLVGEFKTRRLRSVVLDEIEIQKRI